MKLRTWCIRIGHFLTKTGLGVKNALLLMLVCCFAFVSSSYAETDTQGITIRQQNVTLEKVFQAIEKQSGYRFFYNESLLEGAGKVTLNLQNVSLHEALDACFQNQPFTYTIVEKTIIIKKKTAASVPRSVSTAPMNKIIAVRGKVTSGDKPIVGATVTVKGTDNATSTDNEGIFTLTDVDDQGTLVISHVSHQVREVKLEGKTFIAIDLNAKVNDLDEAVVVAYNTTTQKRNTGSITVVKGEQISSLPNRSVDKSLQGLVPGLLVTSGTGQPGGGISNFVLRGIATGGIPDAGATIRNPLIVVDGVPVTQDHTQWDYSITDAPVVNPMSQLNPSDIETITVLKDAAAIALYGAKASNGVIIITTKQGKAGKTRFTLSHQTDIASRLNGKIKLLNQQEYLDLLYQTYRNTDPVTWTDSAITADLKSKFPTMANGNFFPATDWQNEIYTDQAVSVSNDLSISGGNEKTRFYLNFEWTNQNGVYRKTGYDRRSIRFNFENAPTDWLKLGINSTLSYNIQDYASLVGGTFPLGISTYFPPLNPARNEDGSLMLNYTFPYEVANPLAAIEYNKNRNTGFRGLTKMYGEINFLKYFKFSSNLGLDFMLMEAKEKVDPRLYDYYIKSYGGRIQERDTRTGNLISTNTLRFNKTFGQAHAVNILAAQESQIMTNKFQMVSVGNLRIPDYDDIDNRGSIIDLGGYATKETLLSYFSQANYTYKSKYLVTASLRRDGSSRFGERKRFGTYWSTGIGWIISEESFMKSAKSWVDYLKIRGSIGAAGNAAAINRLTRFDQLSLGSFLGNNAVYPYVTGNRDIQWEHTFTWDAGIEARLWKERIGLTADVYNRKTSDLIYTTRLPPVSGYASVVDNIGDMSNKGVEVALSVDVIKNRDWRWNINANWSTNKNVLVKADIPLTQLGGSALANEEGRNFNSFYLVEWAGVNSADGSPQWIDSTGKPNSDYAAAKPKFVGKPQPDGFGAVTNAISYKNVQLSALFYYQYGFQIYNASTLVGDGYQPYENQDVSALDYWKKPGDVSPNPKRYLDNYDVLKPSTRFLYKGDYIRLQTVSLSYDFPKQLIQGIGLSMLKVYVQGHNIALWNSFPGGDPADVGVNGGFAISYPNQKTYSVGLNVGF